MIMFALVVSGAGCFKKADNPQPSDNSSAVKGPYQEYFWKEQGITFKYPTGLITKESYPDTISFFPASTSPKDITRALETKGSGLSLSFLKNTTVDSQIQRYSSKDLKSRAVEKIGSHTFTKIEVYNGYTGNIDTFYFLPFKNGVLIYAAGENSPSDTLLTLSSLEF